MRKNVSSHLPTRTHPLSRVRTHRIPPHAPTAHGWTNGNEYIFPFFTNHLGCESEKKHISPHTHTPTHQPRKRLQLCCPCKYKPCIYNLCSFRHENNRKSRIQILPPEGLQQDLQQHLRHHFGQFVLRDLHKRTHAKLACINIAE